MNPRLPPLANKTSLTYKLTSLSKQKLAREATAPDPDIRRCLGHFRLHVMSMELAQKEMTTRINSFELEDESDEEEEAVVDEVKEMTDKEVVADQPLPVSKNQDADQSVAVDADEEDKEAQAHFHVSFEQTSTLPSSTAGSADLLDEVTTTIPPSGWPTHESEMAASTNPLPHTHLQTQTNASANTTPVNSDTESDGEGEKDAAEDSATDSETETQTDTETETAATDTDPEIEIEPESDEKKSSDGTFFEKGRSCIEKTVQNSSHFWPSSQGQCMSVRISG
ncbi:uncharacterized protein KD926_006711 [Aspergillus affinis]|uniref:uncharacterized protein n=1 Tax=Aspergillus affinis TaxID=1070780 RepID=UPI0022FDF5D9|nr:uncharacterized protein KD926_006711 [Aspergillus affinis]KAI9041637.1 hypothetical protein KD926_006711 [Aspergillus affinis]